MSQCSSYKEGWEFELCLLGISPNIDRLSERDRQPRIWQARISLDLCMALFGAVVIVLGWGDTSSKDGNTRISGSIFFPLFPVIVLFFCHPCSQRRFKYLIFKNESIWKLHINSCELKCL